MSKALTRDPLLLQVFTDAFNLAFVNGIPYERWSSFLNVMTLKEPGNRNVDKLRSLILGEADWNLGGRTHVDRRVLHNAEAHNEIPPEHYGGREKKKATDAVLDKKLALDNIRLSRRPASVTSTDAANCYDRMLHSVISISSQRLGLPLAVLLALLRPLQESKHFIRSAYGDSTKSYGGKRDIPYQGTGQGNVSSSPFWMVISAPLINLMRSRNICSTFTTAITLTVSLLVMVMYVDDNDIFVTSDHVNQVDDIVNRTQECLITWKHLLAITGGVVRPNKCSWVLIDFEWNCSEYRYKSIADTAADIHLDNDNGDIETIQRKEPWSPVLNLDIQAVVNGNEDHELEYLREKIERWLTQVEHSSFPPSLNF